MRGVLGHGLHVCGLHLGHDDRLPGAQGSRLGRRRPGAGGGALEVGRHPVLGGVGQRHLQPGHSALLLRDVHDAGVGQEGHGQAGHAGQGGAVVQRRGQRVADLGQERGPALRALGRGARQLLAHELDPLLLRPLL